PYPPPPPSLPSPLKIPSAKSGRSSTEMPPKKKLNAPASSSKKSNQNQSSQPCKFGIQNFFERHSHAASQNYEKRTASASNAVASASKDAKPTAGHIASTSDADAGALPATAANLNPFTSSNVDSVAGSCETCERGRVWC
ncbi:hypothetical protein Ancab_037277, partial [Ancistrocladus abbreviatus]